MKHFKLTLIIVFYFGMLGTGFAEKLDDKTNWILTSVHDELVECSSFYGLLGVLAGKSGGSKVAAQSNQVATLLNHRVAGLGKMINILPEATIAKMKLANEMHLKTISNDSNNLPILIVKYKDLCNQVVENTESRFNFFLNDYEKKFENQTK
jgi:hypothetical protein